MPRQRELNPLEQGAGPEADSRITDSSRTFGIELGKVCFWRNVHFSDRSHNS